MTALSDELGAARGSDGQDHGAIERVALVQRGLQLNYFTIAYNVVEAVVSLIAGLLAGSVALVGFGMDSVIEVTASGVAQWRLRADLEPARRARVEHVAVRIIGWTFLALGTYVFLDGAKTLWLREQPERSITGIAILAMSAIVMPLLARAKRRVARRLSSRALEADATQTSLCAYLSVIALAGVGLNALFGWWWADPVAALAMTPIIVREGLQGTRGQVCEDACC